MKYGIVTLHITGYQSTPPPLVSGSAKPTLLPIFFPLPVRLIASYQIATHNTFKYIVTTNIYFLNRLWTCMRRLSNFTDPEINISHNQPTRNINTCINIRKGSWKERHVVIVELSATDSPLQAPKLSSIFFEKRLTPSYFMKILIEGGVDWYPVM